MQLSRQEAADLITKWFDEVTPVTALLVSADASLTVKLSGFINGFSTNILISDGTREKGNNPKNYILFPAEFVDSFHYTEARELPIRPEHLDLVTQKHDFSSLSLLYESGVRLSIFET